jgi:uncharacterized membrane protein YgcG
VRARLGALAFTLAAFLSPPALFAVEKIDRFDSQISVSPDGTVTVTETITVLAEGKKIRRGIYRDFPTQYKDTLGKTYRVDFNIISVKRDDQTEDHHTESLSNGVRIYIGKSDRYLTPGRYTYALTYQTNRQIGFFDSHDELYWNVTGNDWDFAIEAATASVVLPDGIAPLSIQTSAFTGPLGATARDFESEISTSGEATFQTTQSLPPGSGLTIVVGWPKGFVQQPSRTERLGFFFEDNIVLVLGIGGLLMVLSYFLWAWNRVGRDPTGGAIFPRFEPPKDLSPAAARYIMRMGFDNRVFSTALISMAVKGRIQIAEELGNKTIIQRDDEGSDASLSFGEKVLYDKLLGAQKTLELDKKHHKKINAARDAFKVRLEAEYHKHFFLSNGRWLLPGIALSVLTIIAVTAVSDNAVLLFGTGIPIIVFLAFLFAARSIWKQGRRIQAIFFGFIAIISGLFNITFAFLNADSLAVILVLALLIGVNVLFYFLLKAPTRAGREVMDEIEGFKKYLATAEKNRLNTLGTIDEQLLLFEKYLPYALALDVDQAWSEKFSAALDAAVQDPDRHYHPRWYHGRSWSTRHPSRFASALGTSLATTVVAASTAPGSSSGFSGGSSGGGGGGGGGGGW